MNNQNPSKPYFDKIADNWDRIREVHYDETLRDFVLHKAFLHPDMIAADIGAGTGFIAAGLVDRVSKVHVVDGSPAMLAAARRNLASFTNVEFHEADGTQLPFEDGTLDVVFANMLLHHLPEPLKAIREMARVLRPGGRLLISNMETHNIPRMQAEMSEIWSSISREHIREWMKEAGFVNIVVGDVQLRDRGTGDNPVAEESEGSIFYASGTRRMSGIRDLVQEKYGAIAQNNSCCGGPSPSGSSCCDDSSKTIQGSDCCSPPVISMESLQKGEIHFEQDYSPEEQAQAPTEAAEFSLGCGNPIAMAGLKPGEVVVDIGSGGGLDSFLAAKKVGPNGRVIGVDMTPEMLKRARRSAKLHGYANVEFRRGDAADLPVEDGVVDVVISNCVINLTEDKGKVFAEVFRVLKPGGRMEISDMVFSGPVGRETRAGTAGWSECISGALIEEEMLDLVAQSGLRVEKVRRSVSHGNTGGTEIYSVVLSAVKPN